MLDVFIGCFYWSNLDYIADFCDDVVLPCAFFCGFEKNRCAIVCAYLQSHVHASCMYACIYAHEHMHTCVFMRFIKFPPPNPPATGAIWMYCLNLVMLLESDYVWMKWFSFWTWAIFQYWKTELYRSKLNLIRLFDTIMATNMYNLCNTYLISMTYVRIYKIPNMYFKWYIYIYICVVSRIYIHVYIHIFIYLFIYWFICVYVYICKIQMESLGSGQPNMFRTRATWAFRGPAGQTGFVSASHAGGHAWRLSSHRSLVLRALRVPASQMDLGGASGRRAHLQTCSACSGGARTGTRARMEAPSLEGCRRACRTDLGRTRRQQSTTRIQA